MNYHAYTGAPPGFPEPRCNHCGLVWSNPIHAPLPVFCLQCPVPVPRHCPHQGDQGEREITEREADAQRGDYFPEDGGGL